MVDELERIWKEAVLAKSRYCPGIIYIEGLKKTTENVSQCSRCPSRDLNRALPEYEYRALPHTNLFGSMDIYMRIEIHLENKIFV
jgi:hypothetical protein